MAQLLGVGIIIDRMNPPLSSLRRSLGTHARVLKARPDPCPDFVRLARSFFFGVNLASLFRWVGWFGWLGWLVLKRISFVRRSQEEEEDDDA